MDIGDIKVVIVYGAPDRINQLHQVIHYCLPKTIDYQAFNCFSFVGVLDVTNQLPVPISSLWRSFVRQQ